MNQRLFWAVFLAGCVVCCETATADHTGPVVSNIFGFDGLPASPPGNVFEGSLPSEVVANHQKRIAFFGQFNQLSPESANVLVWLTWREPGFPGLLQTSAPRSFELLGGTIQEFNMEVIVQFCPPQVGIRVQNSGPSESLQMLGSLQHQTIPVPEPASAVLGLTAAAALWRCRRHQA